MKEQLFFYKIPRTPADRMSDVFNIILRFIWDGIFVGFAAYSIGVILRRFFWKNDFLEQVDWLANRVVATSGLVYAIITVSCVLTCFYLFGYQKQHPGPWIQVGIWVTLTQLLWLKSFQRMILLRLIVAFFLMFSMERLVIMTTSFHRDYIPASWNGFQAYLLHSRVTIALSIILKGLIFFACVSCCAFLKRKAARND